MSNPNLGLGACSAGSTPCGWGSPATQDPVQRNLLRQPDGTQGDCALLNTTTGDFVLDATGNKVGWVSLEQKVYLALRTELGSSAVLTLGIEPIGGMITDDLAAKNQQRVQAALQALISANQIQLISVSTTRVGQSAVQLAVKWKAINTGVVATTFV